MDDSKIEATNSAISLRLKLIGLPSPNGIGDEDADELMEPIIARQRQLSRRLSHRYSAADNRVQTFLDSYLEDTSVDPKLPHSTLVLDQPGLARSLALPADGTSFKSAYIESFKVENGVLHNPVNDRRTTAGVFHVAEGGLPVPDDKIAVPKEAFARLLDAATRPSEELATLPWSADTDKPASCFVSLLLRPVVVPEIPGKSPARSMEIRFFTPGGLVANLDFVEGIFGNGGDPYLPMNDASLAPETWTGHTGCVILAPQMMKLTKKELGLPHWDDATERQRRDGVCWKEEGELYNNGKPFKCCARDERGVIVTVIADNYFGYCKKEVKTQISYSANLFGNVEEEHAGGAIAYPRYNLGQEFTDTRTPEYATVAHVLEVNPEAFTAQPEGHAVFNADDSIVLVPGHATYSMRTQTITWQGESGEVSIPLLTGKTYITPSGYRVHAKHRKEDETSWHLVGTESWSTQAHKPATVSGGGKSEISKSLLDAFVFGEVYVKDIDADFDAVQAIFDHDFSERFANPERNGVDFRSILSEERSLGSVIKLLTPREKYSAEYNEYLESIPAHIKELLFTIKRFYKTEWEGDWRSHFTVGLINGRQSNSLNLDGERIKANMLRVGFEDDGAWRLFSLRPDFSPAAKVQTEDDITASAVITSADGAPSRKVTANCERLLFQRPDDAIVRGYDKQTEEDMSQDGTFISNFQALTVAQAREMVTNAPQFSHFTKPMQKLIRKVAEMDPQATDDAHQPFFVSSADPRILPDGARSRNPRYLQLRPDLANPQDAKLAGISSRLRADIPLDAPFEQTVDVVAAGRRNNPPEDGVPPLCAYNPLHFMELPELFMEFISSMTGKSPSTTGAGSEGALTKAPFNALPAVFDLNASLLSYALTGYDGWLSSAGYIGPNVKVAHDISLLVPELFSRMKEPERDAHNLIAGGYLEQIEDFEYEGRKIEASRLGYRMNQAFASTYFGRIFLHPDVIFTEEMLKPELQDPAIFAESVEIIVQTHQIVAQHYVNDGSIAWAVPPLRALLEIMVDGQSAEGWTLTSPEFRALFERENILASDWYAQRLDAKVERDIAQAEQAIFDLNRFSTTEGNEKVVRRLSILDRLAEAKQELAYLSSPEYRASLVGTLGLQVGLDELS